MSASTKVSAWSAMVWSGVSGLLAVVAEATPDLQTRYAMFAAATGTLTMAIVHGSREVRAWLDRLAPKQQCPLTGKPCGMTEDDENGD